MCSYYYALFVYNKEFSWYLKLYWWLTTSNHNRMAIGSLLITILCRLLGYSVIIIHMMLFSLNKAMALCSGPNFLGPGNITTEEGANHVPILCQLIPVQATPFWKINGTTYYYSDVPPPLVVSMSGREIYIPLVLLSLHGTSFQCFIHLHQKLACSAVPLVCLQLLLMVQKLKLIN